MSAAHNDKDWVSVCYRGVRHEGGGGKVSGRDGMPGGPGVRGDPYRLLTPRLYTATETRPSPSKHRLPPNSPQLS